MFIVGTVSGGVLRKVIGAIIIVVKISFLKIFLIIVKLNNRRSYYKSVRKNTISRKLKCNIR